MRDIEVETNESPIPSRGRKGADVPSKLICDKQSHRLALFVDDVLKSVPDVRVFPQPAGTSMPRPAGSSPGAHNASGWPPSPLPDPPGRAHRDPGAFLDVLPGRVVHRAPFVGCQPDCDADPPIPIGAVQAGAVAGERDEKPQKPLPCGRGSALVRPVTLRSTTLGFARFACTPTNLSLSCRTPDKAAAGRWRGLEQIE